MTDIKTASLDMFTTLRSRLFSGKVLSDIKSVQLSVARYGLLSPIIVSNQNGKLIVIDGRKRLAAIRRLDFMGKLPRSLVNIPYVEVQDAREPIAQTPPLMSNRDLYVTVIERFKQTQDIDTIAQELFLTSNYVRQVLTLTHLSPRLRRAFFNRAINFDQAKSFAATPIHHLQDRAFMSLGPFVESAEILDYIEQRKATPITPEIKPTVKRPNLSRTSKVATIKRSWPAAGLSRRPTPGLQPEKLAYRRPAFSRA